MKTNIFYMMLMCLIYLLIVNIIMMISNLVSKKNKLNFEKLSPFESGFNPKKMNRIWFSLRFFLITMIFLIFDVEIALIIPMIMTIYISNYKNWMLSSLIFMLILMIGLLYEWNEKSLNWI